MIKDASEQILRGINIYITEYQTSLPGRMRQRIAAQSRKVYGNVAIGDRQIHKKLTIKVMYSCTTSTISPMSLGAVQRIFFPKNPRILWKWVGGSRSHSEFFWWKIIPK